MRKIGLITLVSMLGVSGCATQYYHQELRETSQQYRNEKVMIETIQDQFYAFAMEQSQTPETRGVYYLIGEKYIYQIRDLVDNPNRYLQHIEPQYLKLPNQQKIQIYLNLDALEPNQIDVRYTLQYGRTKAQLSEHELQGIRALTFKVDGKHYSKNVSSFGYLLQKDHVNIIDPEKLKYFKQSYPIEIQVYRHQNVKDGHPLLNNAKGYGLAATIDLMTLPLQLFSF